MTEYELHQLIVHTRAEFDQPTFLLIVLSVAFIALGIFRANRLTAVQVRVLQLLYLSMAGFLWLRAYAAIVRLRKLSAELRELETVFDYANVSLQITTYFSRISLLVICLAATIYFLNVAKAQGMNGGKANEL